MRYRGTHLSNPRQHNYTGLKLTLKMELIFNIPISNSRLRREIRNGQRRMRRGAHARAGEHEIAQFVLSS